MSTVAKPAATHLVSTSPDVSLDELQLGVRNHSLPLEALQYPITPIGLHYLLIHFDIPRVDPSDWQLVIGGHVGNRLTLTLDEIKRNPRLKEIALRRLSRLSVQSLTSVEFREILRMAR